MIAYLTHDRIAKDRWDDCIAQAVNGQVYAWSWYLDIVHPGWEALVEIKDDKYQSVMPITSKRKYLIPYLCQPFFAQQLGVFSRKPIDVHTTEAFLHAIPNRFRWVEIRLNEQNPIPVGRKGVDYHQNHLLDLSKDYNTLLSDYHKNTQRNLKKSLNDRLVISAVDDLAPVIQLFRDDRGASIAHWGDAEYSRLHRLSQVACSLSKAFIYIVEHSEYKQIICGALFLKTDSRITFLFSGNSALGKSCHAMTFLIDKVIAEFAGQSLLLDFEGSDDPNLARYYQGFGARPISYPSYTRHCF